MSRPEIDRYLRASKKLDLTGIDFARVPDVPLSRDVIRCLTYMMDIETHTVIYLRELLATKAAEDPEVTAFLSLWVYEEFWHGEALSQFLRAAGERFTPDRPRSVRAYAQRTSSMVAAGAKALAGKTLPDFIAVHMTWGAINELSTLTGYQRLIAMSDHPVLHDLLGRIIKDERRHFAFYRAQARDRLDGTMRAQWMVRAALDRFWAPVGTGVRPQSETDFVIACLFGGPDGEAAVREMEDDLSRLPGLSGMRILRRARARAISRTGEATPARRNLAIAAMV